MTQLRYILISAFIIILVIPNLVMIVNIGDAGQTENQEGATDIDFMSPKRSIGILRNYYNKNIGFKKTCVDLYVGLKTTYLKDDPFPDKVIKGKDGMYFLGDNYNELFKDAFGNASISNKTLHGISNTLIESKKYLKQRNIDFYIVIAPNKHSIYKENLPFELQPKDTRLDRLKNHLTLNTDIEIIDLRDVLIKNKQAPLYLRTDTHWNEYGAFIGYEKVMEVMNSSKAIPQRQLSEYLLKTSIFSNGDITKMINLEIQDLQTQLLPKFAPQKEVLEATEAKYHTKNGSRSLKLLMYHDSFADAWMDFFNETFGEVVYLKGATVKEQDIEEERPDIVLIELVERNLEQLQNKSP